MAARETWILTEGLAGTEAPCRGLARALGREAVIKRVKVRQPWDSLPGRLWLRPLNAPTAESDSLAPPWPELLISSGNVAAPLAAAIRQASGGTTRVVHIQNPKMRLDAFDLVIAPRHDGVDGPNVVVTRGTLHALQPGALDAARDQWAATFATLPRPLVAFLCGGSNGRFQLTSARIGEICMGLRQRMARDGIGVAVTASRRTGAANTAVLHAELVPAGAYVWNGEPPNPYLGLLAHADIIAVTQDSVSMISEALGTGKPVYWIPLAGRSRRLQRFVDSLTAEGVLRRWPEDGSKLETWSYEPPDDTARAAATIRARFGW